jgi:hypothetical protein
MTENINRKELLINMCNSIKDDFYNKNNKNTFYKNKQKKEISKLIYETFSQEELIQHTVYFVSPDKISDIFFDYEIFKLYANEENFNTISLYLLQILNQSIEKFGEINFHINLNTFTISAAERYKNFLVNINIHCTNTNYNPYIKKLYIYNTPSIIDTIYKILNQFIDPYIKKILMYFSKDESFDIINNLLKNKVSTTLNGTKIVNDC